MLLRDLVRDGRPAWPLGWGGTLGRYDRTAGTGENGILVSVTTEAPELIDQQTMKPKRGVFITMRLDGRELGEPLYWDGPANAPTPDQVAATFQSRLGTQIGDLAGLEIGEAPTPSNSN